MFDLNSDLGESFGAYTIGNDEQLLSLVSSANIATGFHAGDPLVMRRTVGVAKQYGVRIGAHIGYRDLVGFGRRAMDVEPAVLTAETLYQIGALQAVARAEKTEVEYVKPHGALYHRISNDRTQAMAVLAGIKAADPQLKLMGFAGSMALEWAREVGLGVIAEAFADRAYTPEGNLVPRSDANAVIHDPDRAAAQALALASGAPIVALDGTELHITAASLCVHGDNPEAIALVERIRATLAASGIEVGNAG